MVSPSQSRFSPSAVGEYHCSLGNDGFIYREGKGGHCLSTVDVQRFEVLWGRHRMGCIYYLQITYVYLASRGFAPNCPPGYALELARGLPSRKPSVPTQQTLAMLLWIYDTSGICHCLLRVSFKYYLFTNKSTVKNSIFNLHFFCSDMIVTFNVVIVLLSNGSHESS